MSDGGVADGLGDMTLAGAAGSGDQYSDLLFNKPARNQVLMPLEPPSGWLHYYKISLAHLG